MLRSLSSAVAGLGTHQDKLDVVGNNIANVNTNGYKQDVAHFQDLFSQTIRGGSAPTEVRGGTNPVQIGLGTEIGSIDTMHTQGAITSTGRELDLAIEGNGFFMVGEYGEDEEGEETWHESYTRDGAFNRDEEGILVNGDGFRLMGWMNDELYEGGDDGAYLHEYFDGDENGQLEGREEMFNFVSDAEIAPNEFDFDPGELDDGPGALFIPHDKFDSFSIEPDGTISGVLSEDLNDDFEAGDVVTIGRVAMSSFSNPEGMEKEGGNRYIETSSSGPASVGFAGTGGRGMMQAGALEMSNVDLADEFTEMITTSRAYQANTRMISTSDEVITELINITR